MEATGSVTGAVALIRVVNSCIEITKTIQLGQNFADDLETYQLKLVLMRRVFKTQCEFVLRYCENNKESPATEASAMEKSVIGATKAIFDKVQRLFEEAKKKSDAFTNGQNRDTLKMAATFDEESLAQRARNCLDKAPNQHREEIEKQQQQFNTTDKIRWVIYEKDIFNSLVNDIEVLGDDLEKIFPQGFNTPRRESTKLATKEIPNEEAKTTTKAAEKDDPVPDKTGEKRVKLGGGEWVGKHHKGNSVTLNGDWYAADWKGGKQEENRGFYKDNVTEDNAKVINGNLYGVKRIFGDIFGDDD
ncbi:hypothetical protein NHQ30_002095 [Ciborinia camelliae]|nr:hypothetical protein NHQ30_002095 [Ciborinia camelliae]